MGRVYSIPITFNAHTAAGDIAEIIAPAAGVLRLLEIKLSQSSDAGDSESEQLRVRLKLAEGAYTSGSGGSAVTPVAVNRGDVAASFTVEEVNTTDASAGSGTMTTVWEDAQNIHLGWHYLPTPECQEIIQPTDAFVIDLPGAPNDSLTIGGYIKVEEIGT